METMNGSGENCPPTTSKKCRDKSSECLMEDELVIDLTANDDEPQDEEKSTAVTKQDQNQSFQNQSSLITKKQVKTAIAKAKSHEVDIQRKHLHTERDVTQIIKSSINGVQVDKEQRKTMIDTHTLNTLIKNAYRAGMDSLQQKHPSTSVRHYDCPALYQKLSAAPVVNPGRCGHTNSLAIHGGRDDVKRGQPSNRYG